MLRYEDLAKDRVPSKAHPIRPTKASEVRDKAVRGVIDDGKKEGKDLFKMQKFKKVEKRTDTCIKK